MVHESIIKACLLEDRKAYGELYKCSAPYAFTIVKNYISDVANRQDVMQEVYANVFTSLHRYDNSKGEFKPWLARIVVNHCIIHLRKSKKLTMIHFVDEVDEKLQKEEMNFLDELSKSDIEMLLEEMPIGYKTVFLLNVIDGYDHKEISEMLNITTETSRSQLSRSLSWIRKNITINFKDHTYGIEL